MSKFKVGDKVKCIDTEGVTCITKGNVYEVSDVGRFGDDIVRIIDDNGYKVSYYDHRFELVQEPFHFQIGDIVEFGGVEGKVTSNKPSQTYSIFVEFNNESCSFFTSDGKYDKSHTKPLLNLVSRPKKKEKRVVKLYAFYDKSGKLQDTFKTEPNLDEILQRFPNYREFQLVTFEKEIEVEV